MTFASAIILSNGDGSYGIPIKLTDDSTFGLATPAVADFNGDGKEDFISIKQSTNTLYLFKGNGDGTFQTPVPIPLSFTFDGIAAEDMNHDSKQDLVLIGHDSNFNYKMNVWLGNGDGTFRAGQTMPFNGFVGEMYPGDYNGDGKADLAIASSTKGMLDIFIYYGDGAGNFGATPYHLSSNDGTIVVRPADVNGDGKTDLVGTVFAYSIVNAQLTKSLRIFYGTASNNLQVANLTASHCAAAFSTVAVADYNGDGIPDLAFETQDCSRTGPVSISVMSGKGGGSFGTDVPVYTTPLTDSNLFAVRADRNTKPDLVFAQDTVSGSGFTPRTLEVLLNSSAAAFAKCAAPNTLKGINLCSPATTSASPVNFSIGAGGDVPMRKVEVWVDGAKKAEQLYAFSNYAFLDRSIPLANGSHNVAVYAAGVDNSLQKRTFTLSVSGTGGCAQPSFPNATVICSPVSGSTVSNPVSVQARGGTNINVMEVWIDGVKRADVAGNVVSQSYTLSLGSHRLAVIGRNGATVLSKDVSTFTVH